MTLAIVLVIGLTAVLTVAPSSFGSTTWVAWVLAAVATAPGAAIGAWLAARDAFDEAGFRLAAIVGVAGGLAAWLTTEPWPRDALSLGRALTGWLVAVLSAAAGAWLVARPRQADARRS
ncbi:MAG TPA: hypothetical protein VF711_09215 [Acidimicrobiales bacterium]